MKFSYTLKPSTFRLGSLLWIALVIAATYAPFLGTRTLRMSGDEKVYVSQALEMAQAGNWFVQRLQDEPNYYKGPLHYLLMRVGLLVFGKTPWAVLYMNFFLLLGGSLALAALVRRRLPEWKGGDVWTGLAFALCAGVYSHTWATQMESELCSLFAIAFYLLDRLELGRPGYLFWTLAGVIGWSKSPLHSCLAGASALLFWTFQGEIGKRLRSLATWKGALFGIGVGAAGYLPALLLDRENFINIYLIRETLSKGGTGQHWSVSIVSTFGFYLFPWALIALTAYLQGAIGGRKLIREPRIRRLLALSVAGFLPSALFFYFHPYHFENYNLPIISSVILGVAATWGSLSLQPSRFWSGLYRGVLALTALVLLAFPALLIVLSRHFAPMPEWWPAWLVPLATAGTALSIGALLRWGILVPAEKSRPDLMAVGLAGFFVGFSAFFSVLGERELVDLRAYLARAQARGEKLDLTYYNLNRNIWSEWGYLNLWLHEPVRGIHTPEKMREEIRNRSTVLVAAKENGIGEFKDFMAKEFPKAQLEWTPWKRWRTRGQSDSGKPLWQEAWEKRDLGLLAVDYYIVKVKSPE